jgi:RNA polymerase sigma factor (sigma-70 family)
MVLGVCRRILRNVHDAEDAFQATFLVLARQADSIRSRQVVASWLYGVAYRTAMKARAMNAKRRTKERQASEMARSDSSEDASHEELLARLDHELNRLPEKYRVPVVLYELEGRSRKDIARLLGVPEGTLSWRLAQAKKLLARRLSRYGTVALAALISESAGSGWLSPALRASTLKTVFSVEVVSANVLALTEGMMKAMLLTKLKITVCAATLMLVAGVGATGLTYRATAQQPRQESVQANRFQADELESLRLEIEALRKSLQATRERVRTLESELSALKGRFGSPRPGGRGGSGAQGGALGNTGTSGGAPSSVGQSQAPDTQPSAPSGGQSGASQGGPGEQLDGRRGMMGGMQQMQKMMQGRMSGPSDNMMQMRRGQGMGDMMGMRGGMMRNRASDPVSDAEAALKKLRENPGDKQATEALERALKKLKEREKPDQPGEQRPGP